MDTIRNKVTENQNLVTIDLEDYYPDQPRVHFDIKDWLYQGFVIKEKDFRIQVKQHNWAQYTGHLIAFTCSTDAIIPGWVYLLLTSAVAPYAAKSVVGSFKILDTLLYQEVIHQLDLNKFQEKSVIIKGCSQKPVPENAYLLLIEKLQPVVKSIMYGEACSAVPVFKKPRNSQ